MGVWFTSDEHYGHANIIDFCARPFAGVEAMERELVARHNALVGPSDDVYHLGDFAFAQRRIPHILRALNGRAHLVAGNHDRCHASRSSYEKAKRDYLACGFVSVWTLETAIEDDVLGTIALCHLPDELPDRVDRLGAYRSGRPGVPLLCGHVHERWKRRGRCLNVGVDQWDYAPVALGRVREEFRR